MKFSSIAATFTLLFAAGVLAQPPFDPAGTKNVGNGAGGQFIGGQCVSDADCGSGCCANPTGICSGPGVSNAAGKTGCGFGGGAGAATANTNNNNNAAVGGNNNNNNAAAAAAAPATGNNNNAAAAAGNAPANGGPAFDPSGDKNVGNGNAGQFIGGQCLSGADCGSGCCAGPSGICSGPGAQTQNGKTGCGFVSSKRLRVF
ncbi:MAG: hypothetical protein Q9216_004636 [Gyalolechia sp. 2 TL-2023]